MNIRNQISGLHIKKIFFMIVYLSLPIVIRGQLKTEITNLARPDLLTKVCRKEIIKADSGNLLNKEFFKWEDSITTKFWKNHYWFYFGLNQKNEDGSQCHDLFTMNKEKNIVKRITYFCSGWTNASSFYSLLYFLNNHMFIHSGRETDKPMGESGLQLIDGDSLKLGKYIPIRESIWPVKEYIKDEKLYIVIQPIKREINYSYYFLFWVPRGRPDKYDYEKVGNKWLYVFDKNFNLVEKKELKE